MADRLFPCAHLLNPTAATRRIRCSYKYATIVVCICNVIIILFLLQSSFGPSYKMRAAAPAASEELKYTREAEEFRRAMEPVDLIKRVKELQEESGSERQRQGQRKVPRQKNASEISKRLKHLRTPADQKDLLLEDIDEIPWAQIVVDNAKYIASFIANYQVTLFSYRRMA